MYTSGRFCTKVSNKVWFSPSNPSKATNTPSYGVTSIGLSSFIVTESFSGVTSTVVVVVGIVVVVDVVVVDVVVVVVVDVVVVVVVEVMLTTSLRTLLYETAKNIPIASIEKATHVALLFIKL